MTTINQVHGVTPVDSTVTTQIRNAKSALQNFINASGRWCGIECSDEQLTLMAVQQ